MTEYVLQRKQWIPRPLDEVFAFFADARNLEMLTPPWLRFRIVTPEPILMHAGTEICYRLSWHGLRLRWRTRIETWAPPTEFVDVQERGPYRLWQHTHRFEPLDRGTLMRDVVRYALPFGCLGRYAHAWVVQADLQRIFAYRAAKVADLLGAC